MGWDHHRHGNQPWSELAHMTSLCVCVCNRCTSDWPLPPSCDPWFEPVCMEACPGVPQRMGAHVPTSPRHAFGSYNEMPSRTHQCPADPHTHTHSPHLYNPSPCCVLGCAPVSSRGQELIGGPGAFPPSCARSARRSSATPGETRQIRARYVVNSIILILLQGTFVFLIMSKHAFWICRESQEDARRTSVCRETRFGDRPQARFGHKFKKSGRRITEFNLRDCV